MHECCQHCFRGFRGRRSACQCSDHMPHTATSWFVWPSSQKEASSEAGSQKSLQTVCWRQPGHWNYCNHVLWSDGSKVNLFDSDGVQHVWRRPGEEYQGNCALPKVKHGGGSIMVWGCMTTAGTGELRFIEGNMDSNMYCDILKKKMMSSLQKLFSNITTTPNTLPRWQLPRCWRWRWWSGQVCLQTWTLLSTCGASSSGMWRSTMCLTTRRSVMSLWRSGRGCQQKPVQLWWIPCLGGLRQC